MKPSIARFEASPPLSARERGEREARGYEPFAINAPCEWRTGESTDRALDGDDAA